MAIYSVLGNILNNAYDANGDTAPVAYNISGEVVFPDVPLPIPSGNLNASETIPLPDLYEPGKGFTCTGLAYDVRTDTFLVGDIGILQPNTGTIQSQLVKISRDFTTVVGTIPLYTIFPTMSDVQGVTIDKDGTIWVCSPSPNKIYHLTASGTALGEVSVTKPTGISYASADDTFWVLNYNNEIVHIQKDGTVIETFSSTFGEALDQCFLDEGHGYLYITAGANYSGRNNVYRFDINTHEQTIACTVDSYSVEGIWIGENEMVIVNDGYYHSATVAVNLANIYTLN